MIKITNISMALLMVSGISVASDKMYQKFGIKSGKITYKITGSMSMMGVNSKTLGKKRVIFSDYGIKELREESKVVKQDAKITKSHTISYMDRAIIYSVDFNQKRITRMQNPGMIMMGLSDSNTAQQAGLKMLKQMGGKKIGEDNILGFKCELWEAMGTKQCIYKGVPLKTESDIMGAKSSEIATKIDFDIDISDDDYKLPDFPIYNQMGEKLDRDMLSSMDKRDQKDAAKTTDELATMVGLYGDAASSAGVKDGQKPTADQNKKIEDAMMAVMLPKMKEEFISQEKVLILGRECLSSADTVKEANICNKKINEMGGEQEEDFDKWDPERKKEILESVDKALNSIECIKKANSLADIKKCSVDE